MNNPNETASPKPRGRPATGQAKTPAQRMRERRQRMKYGDKGGEREITVVLTLTALHALRRMAKRDGVTQKQFLDTLLRQTETCLIESLSTEDVKRYLFGESQETTAPAASSNTENAEAPAAETPIAQDAPAAETVSNAEESRICDPAPTPHRRDNKSGFTGVSFHKASGKWQAQVRENGKVKALKLHATPEEANAARLAYLAERDGQ